MKKVLLSGATGFIGRHCLPLLLDAGYEVHAVTSRMAPENVGPVRWYEVDMLCPERVWELLTMVQPTHLLHFAWYAVPGEYWTSEQNFRWVEAGLSLARAFAAAGGQRIVMAGTNAEYDWEYGYCTERRTPLRPSTPYGICKHSLQTLLESFSKQVNLSAAWGRIFDLYGPYEHPTRLVPSVIRSLLLGETARCSHGNQVRDYLYVKDVAAAFVALLEGTVQGPVNIASGRPIALREIIFRIAGKLKGEPQIKLGALSPRLNDPPLLVGNVNRLFHEVGWQPKYDLDCGLDQTISWWRDQVKLR